jgi:hypothetical protein
MHTSADVGITHEALEAGHRRDAQRPAEYPVDGIGTDQCTIPGATPEAIVQSYDRPKLLLPSTFFSNTVPVESTIIYRASAARPGSNAI